jgi:molecular chaperone GrpE (heat shock protein)
LVYEVTPTGLRQYIGDIQQFLLEKRSDTIAAYEAGRSNGPGGNPGGKDTQAKIKTSEKASAKGDRKQAYENQKLAKKLKNRINKREKEIAEFEAKEAALNEEMSALDPTDSMATVAKAKEFETVQRDLQKALDDWEAATSELEALHNLD